MRNRKKIIFGSALIAFLIIFGLILCLIIFRQKEPEQFASVDFGYLSEEEYEMTIKKLDKSINDEDVEIYAYDFELVSGQFDGAVEIIIPYEDQDLQEDEEILSVCGKYFNEETSEWEDVFYTVDSQANQVHILTNHFSTYSVFKVKNPTKRSAYISEVNAYAAYMNTSKAQTVLEAYANRGTTWREDVVESFLNATGTLEFYTVSSVPTLLSLGGAYDDLISSQLSDSLTMLGVTTSCAQFAYDAYTKGLDSKETSISGMKNVLNLALNFSTNSIQLAYLGVGFIDIALTEVSTYAIASKYESTKNIYDAYYNRAGIKRKVKDWYEIYKTIYKDNKSNPQTVLDLMVKEIDRYVNEFWEVSSTDWESWIDAYDKNGKLTKYPWPSKSDQINISNNFKAEIYSYLEALFQKISRDFYYDSLIEREKDYKQLAAILNQRYTIKIQEEEVTGKPFNWANCYVKMSPLSDETTESAWTIKLDDKARGNLVFTLLAHENAGFPMKLEFYKTKADLEEGKVAASTTLKPFINTVKTFTIKAKVEKVDYSGTFIGVLNVTETGKDINVTTTVTFEKDSTDGSYYKIVCTNDETGSTYINGSYFVRWSSGEANIAGGDFKFSIDGMSFSATMKDFNNNVWGTINANK